MSQWYYASGGDRQGPCGDAEMASMLRSGMLDLESQVWRDGLTTWHRAGDLPELRAHLPQAAPAPAAVVGIPPYGGGNAMMIQEEARGLDSLYRSYLICLYVGIPCLFILVGYFMILAAAIMQLVLLARLWGVMRDAPSEARTTPGKAVGFLFIPIFGSLYWIFQAYPGLASDMKDYGRRRGIPVSDESGMGICAAIFALLGGVLSFFIFFPIFLGRMKDNAQRILQWKAAQQGGVAPTPHHQPHAPAYAPY